jgi:hypothetical protein
MPIEVWNKVVVEGPEDDVQRFVEGVISEERDSDGEPYLLDFTAHVPYPPEFTRDDVRRWAMDAWGCLQPTSAEVMEREPGRVVYFLVTATSVPIPWLDATAAAEPALSFELEYMEEFADQYGRRRYEGGKLVRDDDIEPTDLDWVTWDEENE